MLKICRLKSGVQIAHDEAEICNGIRLKFICEFRQTHALKHCANHVSSGDGLIRSSSQMHIHEAKCLVVKSELEHYAALVANQIHDTER